MPLSDQAILTHWCKKSLMQAVKYLHSSRDKKYPPGDKTHPFLSYDVMVIIHEGFPFIFCLLTLIS
jgi:hypothetical protein